MTTFVAHVLPCSPSVHGSASKNLAVDLASRLLDALALAALARPDETLWSGAASRAVCLRIETLIQELSRLGNSMAEFELTPSDAYAWSSASLFN